VRAWAAEHGVPCTDIDVWEHLDGCAGMTDRDPRWRRHLVTRRRVAASVDALVLGVDVGPAEAPV
jgi:hypothetical protein